MNGRAVLLGGPVAAFALVAALSSASADVPLLAMHTTSAVASAHVPAMPAVPAEQRCEAVGGSPRVVFAESPAIETAPSPARDELLALVAALDTGADGDDQVRALCALLATDRALAAELPALALDSRRPDRACLRLVQALERCGDAACQDALVAMAAAADASAERRGLALRALGGVEVPTRAVLDALWSHARGDEAAVAAVRAFGHATAKLVAADRSQHRARCAALRQALRSATDCRVAIELLRALAAAKDPDVADEATLLLGAVDARLRAAAAHVLLGCADEQAAATAHDLLRTEPDAEVRRILRRGLALRSRA